MITLFNDKQVATLKKHYGYKETFLGHPVYSARGVFITVLTEGIPHADHYHDFARQGFVLLGQPVVWHGKNDVSGYLVTFKNETNTPPNLKDL